MENHQKQTSASEAAGYIAGAGIGMARTTLGGKPVSSAIIVLAGAVLIVGGGHIQHSDTQLFVMALGCVVGFMGLLGWFIAAPEKH